MSWPRALYYVGQVLLSTAAIVAVWRSADDVIPENRRWTRAWRISLTFMGFSIDGWWFPVGAAFMLLLYRDELRRRPVAAR